MGIPDDERLPPDHRSAYGDFSHISGDGKYWFEWTPFTPAIVAWQNAERLLRSAAGHLREATQLQGFAIAGMDEEYHRMIESLKVFADDTNDTAKEAGNVAKALDNANASYAAANDASAVEYAKVVAAIGR
jgi:hypothetical protein